MRCFTYVEDGVDCLMRIIENPSAVCDGRIFNIGNPRGISILELAERIKKFTRSKSRIEFVPYEKAYEKGFEDMRHRKPDISKIQSFIKFSPKVEIDELFKRTIKYLER